MSTFYVGQSAELMIGLAGKTRYFYGLRRNDDGELFLVKIDQLVDLDSIEINKPGDPQENYPDFEEGFDFYDGRNSDHELSFENLNYEQYKWDGRSMFYYVDSAGQLVQRTNQGYSYPTNISSEG